MTGTEPGAGAAALSVPQHQTLPAEVREAFVGVERKCSVFIFPQLRQLGAGAAVARLQERASELAGRAAEGQHEGLAAAYQELLGEAQAALREARAEEVQLEVEQRQERRSEGRLQSSLEAAKAQLPAARMGRLRQQLEELGESAGAAQRSELVEAAISEWERLSQVRQAREAERLADRAHSPLRPRERETARSRRALRDRDLVVELARSFGRDGAEEGGSARQ